LREESSLLASVEVGLGALRNDHREYLDDAIRSAFADSLDLDEALKAGHEHENRWDYLLGHAPSAEVVALEPHCAKQDEITTVVKKRRAAIDQLKDHLKAGARVSKWLWVASGKVHFADTEKARRLLDQNGIEFVGTRVRRKHLSADAAQAQPRAARGSDRGA
jgi:hypothetical protein